MEAWPSSDIEYCWGVVVAVSQLCFHAAETQQKKEFINKIVVDIRSQKAYNPCVSN